jgi:hypothetical protein
MAFIRIIGYIILVLLCVLIVFHNNKGNVIEEGYTAGQGQTQSSTTQYLTANKIDYSKIDAAMLLLERQVKYLATIWPVNIASVSVNSAPTVKSSDVKAMSSAASEAPSATILSWTNVETAPVPTLNPPFATVQQDNVFPNIQIQFVLVNPESGPSGNTGIPGIEGDQGPVGPTGLQGPNGFWGGPK